MDEVFRSLNDSSRRLLLDRLRQHDGQSLAELCSHLPDMTRFGVMKHLAVLEEAGLVVTRKAGRYKHHYLNPIPIRMIHDRWISKFTEPVAAAIARLKTNLEEGAPPMSTPDHVYQAFIRADIKEVWRALVDGDMTVRYYYGTRVESDWEEDADIRYYYPDGSLVAEGTVLAIDPPHRLEMTFLPHWDPELNAEGPVRQVWLVEEADGVAKLTVETFDMDPSSKTYRDFTSGYPFIISGLKTLLETGDPLAG